MSTPIETEPRSQVAARLAGHTVATCPNHYEGGDYCCAQAESVAQTLARYTVKTPSSDYCPTCYSGRTSDDSCSCCESNGLQVVPFVRVAVSA